MTRSLADTALSLNLYDKPWTGNASLRNVKAALGESWRRSIRSVGGFWLGTANYAGPAYEQRDLFLNGLGMEIRETLGQIITWQGFITQLDLTVAGLTYTRSYLALANRVQAIYTRLGDNLLTNGSAELGAWAAFNSPSGGTPAQSTAWVSDGVYSCYILNKVSPNGGALIQNGGVTIVAKQGYDFQMSVKLVSGTWTLWIRQHGAGVDGTGHPLGVIGSGSVNTVGQSVLRASVPATNTYAGQIDVGIYNADAIDGEIYCDLATFRLSPVQARTAWLANAAPQGEYGVIESALLLASASDDHANAQAALVLATNAWPRTNPPESFGTQILGLPDGLAITVGGYAFEMANKYTIYGGQTQNASVHVANLVAADQLVTAGPIAANVLQYQIDDRAPLKNWAVLKAIIQAGDAAGHRWQGGVYAGRQFSYGPASTAVDYHYRGGQLLDSAGGPVEPWLARPGNIYLDEMPAGPGGTISGGSLSGNVNDDPHVVFIEEVELNLADWLAGGQGLSFRQKAV